MRIVVQRVKEASVVADGELNGKIGQGALVLFGVKKGDVEQDIDWLAKKLVNLRMFTDEQGKMNLSLLDVGGEALVVSQFTLYGDCTQGRRPDFGLSAPPELARPMYDKFVAAVEALLGKVETGRFAAKMEVSLINDGPVTFIIDGKN